LKLENDNFDIDGILKFIPPATKPQPTDLEYDKAGNKFVILSLGKVENTTFTNAISTLASNFIHGVQFDDTAYNDYLSLAKNEIFYNKNYQYTIG
jgi:hypothetical protein